MRFHAVLLIVGIFVLVGCDRTPDPISQKPEATPDPICQELDATIDGSIREAAISLAEGDLLAKGAIQQAAGYIAANNYLQVIRINLDLQSQHKCPLRKSIINPMIYNRVDVLNCMNARLKDNLDEMSKLCDPKNWNGNAETPIPDKSASTTTLPFGPQPR